MYIDAKEFSELEIYLEKNKIPKDQICIVGSAVLALVGIRKNKDFDFIMHSSLELNRIADHSFIEKVKSPWSTLFSDDEIIEKKNLHTIYKGIKFVIPELLYHRKSWEYRPKDKLDIVDLDEYSKSVPNWNYEILNGNLPRNSFLKRFFKKYHYFKKLLTKILFRNTASISREIVSTRELFLTQFNTNEYNRYDIIVRYMSIDCYLNGGPFTKSIDTSKIYTSSQSKIDIYNKMQIQRSASQHKDPWRVFSSLIQNIKENGFDQSNPILVNKNLQLLDGAHRLSCALYFNVPYIPIAVKKSKKYPFYGINWFKSNNFSLKERNNILLYFKNIILNHFIYFEVVLWPPVQDYFDEIEQLISNKYNVLESSDYNLLDFENYVRHLYKIDDIKYWKVNLKIEAFTRYSKNIRIMKILIPSPNFRCKNNGKIISKEVEQLKFYVRERYKHKVKNYFHDIIIHIGDNFCHSEQSSTLLD